MILVHHLVKLTITIPLHRLEYFSEKVIGITVLFVIIPAIIATDSEEGHSSIIGPFHQGAG